MIVVLGAGESGTAAALLAKTKGLNVFVSDANEIKPNFKQELIEHQIDFEEGKHSYDKVLSADLVIKSPGIPDNVPIIQAIKAKGTPIISEIEFAWQFDKNATYIAITGSNGKTTTTNLTYHIFKTAGLDVAIAGNVGTSLARTILNRSFKYYVLELSSFQLDYCFEFNPKVAILLNITPDHLDRYDYNFQNYINSKFRITQNQKSDDYFVYWTEDEAIVNNLHKTSAFKLPFALQPMDDVYAFLEDGRIIASFKQRKVIIEVDKMKLLGKHNYLNAMASILAGLSLGIDGQLIEQAVYDFAPIEHRLEFVDEINGVRFINDSKATNVKSVWYALDAVEAPIVLILGGIDKGNDYSELYELVRQKVKAIVALGKDNSKIVNSFKDLVAVYDTDDIEEAVRLAYSLALPEGTVLLSPACASFDLFENYIDRGNKFKQAIKKLKDEISS